jgi:hypothetical protein
VEVVGGIAQRSKAEGRDGRDGRKRGRIARISISPNNQIEMPHVRRGDPVVPHLGHGLHRGLLHVHVRAFVKCFCSKFQWFKHICEYQKKKKKKKLSSFPLEISNGYKQRHAQISEEKWGMDRWRISCAQQAMRPREGAARCDGEAETL